MRPFRFVLMTAAAGALAAGVATAQTQEKGRYGSDWNRPAAPAVQADRQKLDAMIGELRRMVEKARRARAADPAFLSDLSDLALRYAWPWHVRVLADDFRDGDITRDPAWSVAGGEVRIDRRGEVRTVVEPGMRRETQPSQGNESGRDVAQQLLGAFLQAQQNRQQAEEPRRHRAPREAVLSTPVRLSNEFAIQLTLVSDTRQNGRLEFGVTQGSSGIGYRIAYNAHATPSLEVLRVGSRGTAVIDATRAPVTLEDQAPHTLQLTRARDGRMVLSVDGRDVVTTFDRAFEDGFDGVVIRNAGGDFALRRVAAYGVR